VFSGILALLGGSEKAYPAVPRHLTGICLIEFITSAWAANNADLSNLKATLNNVFKTSGGQLTSGVTLFVYLLGGASSSNSADANAGVYQTLLLVLVSWP